LLLHLILVIAVILAKLETNQSPMLTHSVLLLLLPLLLLMPFAVVQQLLLKSFPALICIRNASHALSSGHYY
jgi:hypothetical protein